jgi:hypothetical protein
MIFKKNDHYYHIFISRVNTGRIRARCYRTRQSCHLLAKKALDSLIVWECSLKGSDPTILKTRIEQYVFKSKLTPVEEEN